MTLEKKTGNTSRVDFKDANQLLLIEEWARDGLTDTQIANNLGYRKDYFVAIKRKFPEVDIRLKNGRKRLCFVVENALYKRAMGMSVKTTQKIEKKDRRGNVLSVIVTTTTTEVPPDTKAALSILTNRKPEMWNAQPAKVDITTRGVAVTPDNSELEKRLDKIVKKLSNRVPPKTPT